MWLREIRSMFLPLHRQSSFPLTCLERCIKIFYRENRLDLVPLISEPSWRFDQEGVWRLPGAHGEEVVRSVFVDEKVCIFFRTLCVWDWVDGLTNNDNSRTLCSLAVRMGSFVRGSLKERGLPRQRRLQRVLARRRRTGRRGGLNLTR